MCRCFSRIYLRFQKLWNRRLIANQAFLEEIIPSNLALKITLPKKDSDEEKNTFINTSQVNELKAV